VVYCVANFRISSDVSQEVNHARRTWITSKLSNVCQRERGNRVSVTSSSASCSGEAKASSFFSGAARASNATQHDRNQMK
jgi:hypothetical protein